MRELLPNDGQCMNAVGTPSFPTQEHLPIFINRRLTHVHELSTNDHK